MLSFKRTLLICVVLLIHLVSGIKKKSGIGEVSGKNEESGINTESEKPEGSGTRKKTDTREVSGTNKQSRKNKESGINTVSHLKQANKTTDETGEGDNEKPATWLSKKWIIVGVFAGLLIIIGLIAAIVWCQRPSDHKDHDYQDEDGFGFNPNDPMMMDPHMSGGPGMMGGGANRSGSFGGRGRGMMGGYPYPEEDFSHWGDSGGGHESRSRRSRRKKRKHRPTHSEESSDRHKRRKRRK